MEAVPVGNKVDIEKTAVQNRTHGRYGLRVVKIDVASMGRWPHNTILRIIR